MSSTPTVPTGNTFDKYGSTNPVVRRLMAGFERTLDELFAAASSNSPSPNGSDSAFITR